MSSKLLIAYRGDADTSSLSAKAFCGTNYFSRFSSSKPISITAVAFYGFKPEEENIPSLLKKTKETDPPKPKPRMILAFLTIKESMMYNFSKRDDELATFLPGTHLQVNVANYKRGDVFFVKLPRPVIIPENIIFDISFQLKGIMTYMEFHGLPKAKNVPKVLKIEGSDVEVNVHLSSSQCAGFQFRVLEKVAAVNKTVVTKTSKQKSEKCNCVVT